MSRFGSRCSKFKDHSFLGAVSITACVAAVLTQNCQNNILIFFFLIQWDYSKTVAEGMSKFHSGFEGRAERVPAAWSSNLLTVVSCSRSSVSDGSSAPSGLYSAVGLGCSLLLIWVVLSLMRLCSVESREPKVKKNNLAEYLLEEERLEVRWCFRPIFAGDVDPWSLGIFFL